jgi:hypothetical protein
MQMIITFKVSESDTYKESLNSTSHTYLQSPLCVLGFHVGENDHLP